MKVVATAGHVDHGKSTLVRALTGTDPDRWAEEHRRGLTIDLGFAHTTLPSGQVVAFVDVPGHQRFIANMLAGLGPAPAVMLVVAADEGWRAQSSEHLAAIDALGLAYGVLVITRCDLADPGSALRQSAAQLAGTSLEGCPVVAVSAATGAGLDELRKALEALPTGRAMGVGTGRARLWVDRSFTLRGAGTVVTGTLASGSLRVGQKVSVAGREVTVRRLQSLGADTDVVSAVARVAVNLRGIAADAIRRGNTLLTGEWHHTTSVDVRVRGGADLPERLMIHLGTAATEVRVRRLGGAAVRLTWSEALPLQTGDRLVLRDPGRQQVLTGAVVLDADPPGLTRRGAAGVRVAVLADAPERFDARREIARRGYADVATLRRLGAEELGGLGEGEGAGGPAEGLMRIADWLIDPAQWRSWSEALAQAVKSHAEHHRLQGRMPMAAAGEAIGLPDLALLAPLAATAGLLVDAGHLAPPGITADLGPAEAGLRHLEQRLAGEPFRAPERAELADLGLGVREIAAAVRLNRLIDLDDQIVLAPNAPALAMRRLAQLRQPFTTSEARQALSTTRRVIIPLLEHLDSRGWTRRLDPTQREVVHRGTRAPDPQ